MKTPKTYPPGYFTEPARGWLIGWEPAPWRNVGVELSRRASEVRERDGISGTVLLPGTPKQDAPGWM